MIAVKAVQDESNHWYLIPNELINKFDSFQDEFELEFNKYLTGGCLNNTQIFI